MFLLCCVVFFLPGVLLHLYCCQIEVETKVPKWHLFLSFQFWGVRSVIYVWSCSHLIRSWQLWRMSSEIARVSSREKWTSSPAVWLAHSSNLTKSSKHGSAFWLLFIWCLYDVWHLPCLHSSLEWEQLLEQHRTLQDSFDQLQAEAKFEADQAGQQIEDLKAQLTVSELINSTIAIFILKT